MPGKRAFGIALIQLIGEAVAMGRRQAPRLEHLPRALLRDFNLPCCGPLPQG